VPTVTRARTIPAGGDEVWALVSDPAHLPRWWPDVVRVEEATPEAWTEVLATARAGKMLRADFTRVEAEPGRHLMWRQELEESPFERLLSEAVTEVNIEPSSDGTRVELRTRQRPRGIARFGGFMFRRAARRKLDEALDGLERVLGP
jgi:uncharacterized protein YndB with AHSA1/START domain